MKATEVIAVPFSLRVHGVYVIIITTVQVGASTQLHPDGQCSTDSED